MGQISEQTLYEILEVSSDATQEEIHKAFHRAKNTYSPNSPALYSVFSKEEAEELLRLIDEAYSVLSNQVKRKEYDRVIQTPGGVPSSESAAGTGLSLIQGGISNGQSADSGAIDFAIPEADVINYPDTTSGAANRAHRQSESAEPNAKDANDSARSSNVSRYAPPAKTGTTANANMGRTRFSHYDVNPYFEEEIKNQEVFDGTFLQKVRMYKGISLDQIAEFTRIGKQYLSAVETNDFGALPAPVFVRGFLIQMARALGLDEKKVADSFMKLFKETRGK